MVLLIEQLIQQHWFKWLAKWQFPIAALIFAIAALLPNERLPLGQTSDHTLHFIGNLLLILSAYVALHPYLSNRRLLAYIMPYSLLIEYAQWFTPTRTLDVRDIYANLFGLIAGYLLINISQMLWRWMQKNFRGAVKV
jgi:VanZ family protein